MAQNGSVGEASLRSERDIVLARQLVRKLTQELKFSLVDQTKMVTAASELARNAYVYGRGGTMRWQLLQNGTRHGLKLLFADEGPGIPNLDLAMTYGWTSGTGLGMGSRDGSDRRETPGQRIRDRHEG